MSHRSVSIRRRAAAPWLAASTVAGALACVEPTEAPPVLVPAEEGDVTAVFLPCGDGIPQVGELCVAPPTTVQATATPLGRILAVDIDADGIRDLIGVTATRIYVVFGTPGGFGTWSFYQPAGGPDLRDIAAGDFDGDGDLDLAASDFANDRIVVRRYTGGGGFAAPVFFPTQDGPTRLIADRMNADGRADLVVLADNAGTVQVRLGSGALLGGAVSYPVGDARDFAIGDCDANGTNDVMYLNGTGTATTLRARPNGNGALGAPTASGFPFGPTPTIPHYSAPLSIAAGRMNADVAADVVVSAEWSRLVTGRSNGNCTFTQLAEVQTYAWTYRVRLADHDGNGTLDVGAPHYTDPVDDELSVVFGIGNGDLDPLYGLVQRPTGTVFNDVAFGDFNADGDRDLITGSAPGFLLFRGTP